MIGLVLIADDFTGALDTGIQFAKRGAVTKILVGAVIEQKWFTLRTANVLVVDAEMRHLPQQEAYDITKRLVAQVKLAGVPYLYIKTDSGLRGNIGAELKAALDVNDSNFLPFVPAYPDMGRVTRLGIHYISGVPIDQSVFGKDPFEPVKSPYVKDLFAGVGTAVTTQPVAQVYNTTAAQPTICVFDAETNTDILRIAKHLKKQNQLQIMAGCAGFAAFLPEVLGMESQPLSIPPINKPLLVVCGSLNPITKKQIEYGEKKGFARIVLSSQQLAEGYFATAQGQTWLESLKEVFKKNSVVMVDTGVSNPPQLQNATLEDADWAEAERTRTSRALGLLLKHLLARGEIDGHMLMVIGGDTLLGFAEQIHCKGITLLCEIEPGTVLSSVEINGENVMMISKSGGFGAEDLLERITERFGDRIRSDER